MSKVGYVSEEGLENLDKGLEFVIWPDKSKGKSVAQIQYKVVATYPIGRPACDHLKRYVIESRFCPDCGLEL